MFQTKPYTAKAKPYIQNVVPYIEKAKPYAPPLAVAAFVLAAIPVILTFMFLAAVTSPVSEHSVSDCTASWFLPNACNHDLPRTKYGSIVTRNN